MPRAFTPAPFHSRHARPYFEGWYFKHTSKGGAFSVIPGVFCGKGVDDFAFIQLIFGQPPQSFFIPYDFSEFRFSPRTFEISIGKNEFSAGKVRLDIEEIGLTASLSYSNHVRLQSGLYTPTIMGPFSYLPVMQCSHEVLSLTHRVSGSIQHQGGCLEFNDADGYMEKDWGSAFPESWVWMQCNHRGDALMCSAASIPFAGFTFTGLICVLLHDGKQYRFATYNGGALFSLAADCADIEAVVARGAYRLRMRAHSDAMGTLKAPTPSGINRDIAESITARYDVTLTHRCKTLFDGRFENGGLEMLNPQGLMRRRTTTNL